MSNNLDEIKETIKKLQEKVESLEKENKDSEESIKHIRILENIKNYAVQEIGRIFEVNNNITAATICISKSKTIQGEETNITSTCIKSFDEIDEERLSSAVEVFTNPRRIAILKVLIAQPNLTATEITQKTGLVGGQLYHHLKNLEAEQLITKENEKYKVPPCVQGMLLDLYNVFGFGLPDTLWKLEGKTWNG